MFEDELGKLLENILDPNTEAKTKRKLTLEVTFRDVSSSWSGTRTASPGRSREGKRDVRDARTGVYARGRGDTVDPVPAETVV